MRLPALIFVALLLIAVPANSDVQASQRAEAAKANNLGTALMNQQLLDKAAAKFADAYKLDPALVQAEVNRGIALVYLQKMPEAEEALKQAAARNPKDPHVWYAMGILYRIEAQYPQALESFQKVAALDPEDADTHYFLGSVLLELHQPDQALAEFQTALRINPIHASAQFGLAKVLQRLGKREEATTAFHRFETLNQEKIGFPLAHTYGDEGHYSRVQDALNLADELFVRAAASADEATPRVRASSLRWPLPSPPPKPVPEPGGTALGRPNGTGVPARSHRPCSSPLGRSCFASGGREASPAQPAGGSRSKLGPQQL